ncbi:putative zinc finger motif, c2HC5-type domain-containing protein [Hirsutella rhossiliensis]|uniref:Zinc finger motif, c2HC5-type domain-containing protein n=1 Tax=Hirsutella rhossiliensis TaxID=111463 RepID=A0A9P8SM79_9HYPO|nr:putative zinc finger motif, c2HC5-type domain-containing protein [Hirsutella rhossiliensis]KAH0967711.1 putative zinc finger motif, c2HC5-type domain-containing protein [Hirsutella rhossiliensis]
MSRAQLSQLLPLPEEELQQVLDYAASLSKPEAATHFHDLLGDSPLAVDFISSFNSHRRAPAAPTSSATAGDSGSASEPPRSAPKAKKLPEYQGPATTAYKKNQDIEYIPKRDSAPGSSNASRAATPSVQTPVQPPPKQHASAAGSTPKPSGGTSAKVAIPGGMPMAGQSTALSDLDAAIRALEITTNPTMDNGKRRKCNCVATRHPLQSAAPNCLSCGKVICIKEGLGQCTFCGSPLLNADEAQAMLRELKDERGRERMTVNAAVHRKADVSKTPAPFTQPRNADAGDGGPSLAEAAAKARAHRDKLLDFQAQNARRTTVRDEAADFDVSGAMTGTGNMWASPEDRARELKRQQKLMREMEWNAQPDYEKRRQVISIDLVGGKVVRKMAAVTRPASSDEEDEAGPAPEALSKRSGNASGTGGAFSRNPLLGALMRPVFEPKGEDKDTPEPRGQRERKKGWRRVQDDVEDNEAVILDGGAYGHSGPGGGGGRAGDEPWCG